LETRREGGMDKRREGGRKGGMSECLDLERMDCLSNCQLTFDEREGTGRSRCEDKVGEREM